MNDSPMPRRQTRQVQARGLAIGGGAPVSVQSMTSVPLSDTAATIRQIESLARAGADLVRLAVLNEESIPFLIEVRREVDLPLSADIHFNHRLAIRSIEAGIDKVRINPGNIGGSDRVREVVKAARERRVPIRIGVNGGSVDRKKYPSVNPESLVESALEHVLLLEDNNFTDIVVSIKSSDIFQTVEANRLFAQRRDYPLHIGLTEAGFDLSCTVQSSIAIGHLLLCGIGDTIRVSKTGDPVDEVVIGKKILESLDLRTPAVRMISCPTCGRTDPAMDILAIAREIESRAIAAVGPAVGGDPITIAVMGCEVNGPGEAAHADIGIAGGRNGRFVLFARGEKLRVVDGAGAADAVINELAAMRH